MNDKVNQWLAFFDDNDRGIVKMAEEKNEILKKARKEIEYLTGDEEVQRLAWLHEKWEMDRASNIEYAKEEGIKEGIKEGTRKKETEIVKRMKKQKY